MSRIVRRIGQIPTNAGTNPYGAADSSAEADAAAEGVGEGVGSGVWKRDGMPRTERTMTSTKMMTMIRIHGAASRSLRGGGAPR